MMSTPGDGIHFARLIDTLEPWLGSMVIVGGWAHRLYRLSTIAQPVEYEPLFTYDTDVALPEALSISDQEIRDRLIANDFKEELQGDFRPPVSKYYTVTGKSGFYAEFLTPLRGSEVKRDGERDMTVSIGGVTAQKLRYLEVLLQSPWRVRIEPDGDYPTTEPRVVQIPNAAAFLAQKALIHDRREPDDKAKDILYIHDTIEIFANDLQALRIAWKEETKSHLHQRAVRGIEEGSLVNFTTLNAAIRDAARMAAGRELSPERVREVCAHGWEQVFSPE